MSTPQKNFIAVDQETGATYRFNDTDWEGKKDRFMELHPNANIVEYDAYNPDDVQDSDNVYVTTKKGAYSFTPSEWAEKQGRFMEVNKDNDVQVGRLRGVDYYYDQAKADEESIKTYNEQLKSLNEEYLSIDAMGDMDNPYKEGTKEYNDWEDKKYNGKGPIYEQRKKISGELSAIQERYDRNPRVVTAREEQRRLEEEYIKKYPTELRNEIVAERQKYEHDKDVVEKKFHDHEMAMGDVGVSSNGLIERGLASLFGIDSPGTSSSPPPTGDQIRKAEAFDKLGAAERLMDEAIKFRKGEDGFWESFGGVFSDKLFDKVYQSEGETMADVAVILKKLNNKIGNLNDLTDEDIERNLSKEDQLLLKAYFEYSDALQYQSGWSKAGAIGGESLLLGLEMLALGGFAEGTASLATKGLTRALEKWVAKGVGKKFVRKGIAKTVDLATRGTLNAGILTALSPSTYETIAGNLPTIDENGNVDLLSNAGVGVWDAFSEKVSELSGGYIGKVLGVPFKPVKGLAAKGWNKAFGGTKFGEWGKALAKGATSDYLKAAGFHGMPIEMLEEVVGNAMRLPIDPDALSDMFTWENMGTMALGFLPMTVLGGGISVAQLGAASKAATRSASNLRNMLIGKGYSEERADFLTDVKREMSATELGLEMLEMKEELKKKGATEEELKLVSDYVTSVAEYQTIRGGMEEVRKKEKDQVTAELEGQYGTFYQESAEGKRDVTQAVLNDSRKVFIVSEKSAAGEYAAIDQMTGKHIMIKDSDIMSMSSEQGQMPLITTSTIDEYADGIISYRQQIAEMERMEKERNEQIAKLSELLPGRLNLGTQGQPNMVAVKGQSQAGVTVVDEQGQEAVLPWEVVGQKMGLPIKVMTDAEIADAEAATIGLSREAKRAQRAKTAEEEKAIQNEVIDITNYVKEKTPAPEEAYRNQETGEIDENAFWENDPEGWADWNDRTNQDGGIDSMEQVDNGIAQVSKQLSELDKMKSDSPNARRAINAQKAALQEKLDRLTALQQKYNGRIEEEVQSLISEAEKKAELTIALRERVNEWREKLGLTEDQLTVYESLDEVPEGSAKRQIRRGKTEGWFNVQGEKAFIFLPHIESLEELDKTIAHEVVTHYGLHTLMGEKAYNELMDKVWNVMSDAAKNTYYNYPGVSSEKDAVKRRRMAAEEFVAHVAESISLDEATAEQKSIWKRIVDFFRNLFKGSKFTDKDIADIVRKNYQQLTEQARKEGIENLKAEAQAQAERNAAAPEVLDDGTNIYSTKTYREGGRDYLDMWLQSDNTISEEERKYILDTMDFMYNAAEGLAEKYSAFGAWSEADVVRDAKGDPIMSVIKANGDYAMNLDFSLVCKKRRALNALLNKMIKDGRFDGMVLREKEIARINQILQKHGFEVACALCFVDAKRYRVASVATQFTSMYNDLVKSLIPKGSGYEALWYNYMQEPNQSEEDARKNPETVISNLPDEALDWTRIDKILKRAEGKKQLNVEEKIAKLLKSGAEYRRLASASDFISDQGFELVTQNNPELLKLYNAKKGTGGPKASLGDVQYLNNIAKSQAFSAEKAYKVGGVRIQSFSDYMPHMFFDYMQMMAELAGKRLPAHAYTKEPAFARLFGMTGMKINLSLVPRVDMDGVAPGLDAEGNYTWAEEYVDEEGRTIATQTFPPEVAFEMQQDRRYSGNVGAIAVGISDEHILKMLGDPNIHFVIPYHKSSLNPDVAKMAKIDQYSDYTNYQTEKLDPSHPNMPKGKLTAAQKKAEIAKRAFDFYGSLAQTNNPKQTAADYLAHCKEVGLIPKFPQFANNENYYKLLVDFNTYDFVTGEYAPQGAVTMTFPDNMLELIEEGLVEDQQLDDKLNAEISEVAEEVYAEMGTNMFKTRITPEQDAAYLKAVEAGDMETAQRMVIEAAKLAMPNTKVVDENGNPKVVYHGTGSKFYTFRDTSDSNELGAGYYFSDSFEMAERYSEDENLRDNQYKIESLTYDIFTDEMGHSDEDYNDVDFTDDYNEAYAMATKRLFENSHVKAVFLNLENPRILSRESPDYDPYLQYGFNHYNEGQLAKRFNDGVIDELFEERHTTLTGNQYVAFSPSQIKSADPVTYDDNGNVIPLSERFNEEKEDIRFKTRTDSQREKLFADAKERFGVTDNFKVAGYMLPDGSLLDFSEANDGGDPNQRSLDHRSIEDVIMEDGTEYESRWMYLADFMNEGAIRLLPEYAGINLMKAPTKEQRQRLMDFIYKYNGEVILEIADERLNNAAYVEYDRRTSPARIFRDIDGYFNEGILPESNTMFKTSFQSANETLDNEGISIDDAALIEEYGLSDIELSKRGNYVTLSKIVVADKNKGNGTRFMNDLVKNADENGWTLTLTPDDTYGASSVSRLKKFYKRFGFKENKGRNTDFNTKESMVRVPQSNTMFKTANNNQAIFVSNAAKAVEGIKMEKATPEQWLKMIEKSGGLKAGEDKWMGLSDWLKSSDKKTLTKQEVLDFINENMIVIEETHYDINAESDAERVHDEITEKLRDRFDHYIDEYYEDNEWDDDNTDEAREYAIEKLREEMGDTFPYTIEREYGSVYLTFPYEEESYLVEWAEKTGVEYTPGVNPIHPTRLAYTTDGLENRHEIALTVPTIESWNEHDGIHFGDAGDGRAVAWIRFGETSTEGYKDISKEAIAATKALEDFEEEMSAKYNLEIDEAIGEMTWEESTRHRELSEAEDAAYSTDIHINKGRRVLVIDEIQSKRHQEGRERGYARGPKVSLTELRQKAQDFEQEMIDKYHPKDLDLVPFASAMRGVWTEEESNTYSEIMSALGEAANKNIGIPDAPFDKNWHELAMKRMLRYAAENGYDVVAWTKGDQQADRYNLGKIYNEIEREDNPNIEGRTFSFSGGNYDKVTVNEDGVVVDSTIEEAKGKPLSDLVGKDLAVKMMSLENYDTIDGEELRIGGEGMKGFYDKMLPAFMNKYGKKWGVKVEDIHINLENGLDMHSVPVTEEMKESVMEGQTMFKTKHPLESPSTFMNSVVDEFYNRYNTMAPAHVVYAKNRRMVAEAFGLSADELADDVYQRIKDEAKVSDGMYVELDVKSKEDAAETRKRILIFVNPEKNMTAKVDAISFHENIHGMVRENEDLLKLGEWLLSHDENDIVSDIVNDTKSHYEESVWAEEVLCDYVGNMMALGRSQEALDIVPDEYKPLLNSIYEKFGYRPEVEDSARESERNDDARRIRDLRISEELQMRNSGNVEGTTDGNYFKTEITPEVRKEMDVISATAIVNGNYMKAPNGKDSKLTPEQWAMVRTKNFKQWFGDWENDPANASKVVDENGEPKEVYHGTAGVMNKFEDQQRSPGFWFVDREDVANGYAESASEEFGEEKNVIPVFLNIRKPRVEDAHSEYPAEFTLKSYVENDNGVYEVFDTYEEAEAYRKANVPDGWVGAAEVGDQHDLVERAKELGHDGVIMMNMYDQAAYAETEVKGTQTNYVVLDANQIKSATDNTGEFSEDADIRFKTETREEAKLLLQKMQENAELLVPRQLTKELWDNEIEGKVFDTPIGKVKFGSNQYDKNLNKGRAKEFGMLLPTILRPDLIYEEYYPEDGAERQTKYVFVKTFYDENGEKHINYASVTVQKEGLEVVESSHRLRDNQMLNKIEKEHLLWNRFASDSTSSAPGSSTDQNNALDKDTNKSDTNNTSEGNNLFSTKPTNIDRKAVEGLQILEATGMSFEREIKMVEDALWDETRHIENLKDRMKSNDSPLLEQRLLDAEARREVNEKQLEILRDVQRQLIDTTPIEPSTDMEPRTQFEYLSQLFTAHGVGKTRTGVRLTPQTLKQELGYSAADRKGISYIVSDSEGLTFDEVAEMVQQDSEAEYLFANMDTMEIKDVILDFISSMDSYSTIRDYVKSERAKEAKELQGQRDEAAHRIEEQYGMSLEQYNEMVIQQARDARDAWLKDEGNEEVKQEDTFDATTASVEEVVEHGKQKALEENAEAADTFMQRLRKLNGNINSLRMAAAAQREYDQSTVKIITDIAQELLTGGKLSDMTRGEVKRLMGIIKGATGKQDLTNDVNRLMDLMIQNQIRFARDRFNEFLKIRDKKVNKSGVETQGKLDIEGQQILDVVRKNIGLSLSEIDKRILDVGDGLFDKSDTVQKNIVNELVGLEIARRYTETIKESEAEEKALRDELTDVERDYQAKNLDKKTYQSFVREVENAIRDNKMQRVAAYESLISDIANMIAKSIQGATQFREAEKQRIENIQHFANSDLEGLRANAHRQEEGRFWNNGLMQTLTSPLATFEQWLKLFGSKSAEGKGYLYNHFMNAWNNANNNEYLGVKNAHAILDAKVQEIFKGKLKRWSDLFAFEKKGAEGDRTPTISIWDDGKMVEYKVTQGNLLYIYMVNKMTDGKMKLRRMGVSEETVDAIVKDIDPRFVQLADWIQDEFLPGLRDKYNAVHERLFGAPMATIDNYFPLKVLANARTQNEDVATPTTDRKPSTITGSIIKRTKNGLALDVTGADAFDVVLEHIQDMEHWAAFAEFNKDLNTLLSYTKFRNKVQNMSTAMGSGKEAWNSFRRTAEIAAGVYQSKPSNMADKTVMNMVKGLTTGKINFRYWTAIKQILSMPGFAPYANPIQMAKAAATPWVAWNWAAENLPSFQKRWLSRQAGNVRLQKNENDWKIWQNNVAEAITRWGMTPNAFVDAITCSIGAKAVYDTQYARYIKDGYSHEKADEKAKLDATTAFNATQQSSEGAFLSAVQSDRTFMAYALTVFRNNSFGMQREFVDALRHTKERMKKGYKEQSIEFMKKQMMRDGLTEEQAERAAKRVYRRSAIKDWARIATFGFVMQFLWNLGSSAIYLLFGDDDDEKNEMIIDAAIRGAFGSLDGLGFGNIMTEGLTAAVYGDWKKFHPSLSPAGSDLDALWQDLKSDPIGEGVNALTNLLGQVFLGVNPQVITDQVMAIVDACDGDIETSKEVGIALLRYISAPQSQIDKLKEDEIDFTIDRGLDLTIEEFAKEYAEYKRMRGAGLANLLYSDEQARKVEDRYIKRFLKRAEELKRTRGNEEAKKYYEYLDTEYKEVTETINELKRKTKEAARKGDKDSKEHYKQQLRDYKKTDAYKRYKDFGKHASTVERLRDLMKQVDGAKRERLEDKLLEKRKKMVDEMESYQPES